MQHYTNTNGLYSRHQPKGTKYLLYGIAVFFLIFVAIGIQENLWLVSVFFVGLIIACIIYAHSELVIDTNQKTSYLYFLHMIKLLN